MKLRGIVLALVLGSMAMLPLAAQVTVGGFLDLNIAGLNVKPGGTGEDYSSYLGFGLGGIVTYPLSDGLAVQAEPVILQKGGKLSEFGETLTIKLLYFEIPVFLRYNIARSSQTLLPYVILGPNLGFRASAKINFPTGGSSDAADQFRGIDLGVGFGGGVEVPQDKLIFFGETRYVIGLNDINKESGDSDESTVKNRGLQILLGIKVPLNN